MKRLLLEVDIANLTKDQADSLLHRLKTTVLYDKSEAILCSTEIKTVDRIAELVKFSSILQSKLIEAYDRNSRLDWMLSIIKGMLEDPSWNPSEEFLKEFFKNRPDRL